MKYKPHEHIPLLVFGLAATPLSLMGLLNMGTVGVEVAATLLIFGSCAAVLGIVAHWRKYL